MRNNINNHYHNSICNLLTTYDHLNMSSYDFFNKSIYEIKVYEFYTEYHGFFLHIYPGNILDEWVQELFLQKLRPKFYTDYQ